jgi:hypothetical protein
MIYSIYYAAALVLAFADLRGQLAKWRIATPQWPAGAWCAMLLSTYAAQLFIIYLAAQHTPWPIALVPATPQHQDALTGAMLALGAAQAYALLGLYRARIGTTVVATGIAMLALSCLAPAFLNADIYAYVGNGLLGSAGYTPPSVAFPGEFATINARWGTPVPAATYGPLWLTVAHLITSIAPSLAGKLIGFRVFSLLLFVALIALLRACGVPPRALAIAALNPGLLLQFVVDAHNDILPIVLVVAAAAIVRKLPYAACALVAGAALVKLPYALLGLPVLTSIYPAGRRYALCALSVVAALALSWFGGGAAYAQALFGYASSAGLLSIFHGVAALAAVAAILAAVAGARRLRAAVWLMPMLGPYTASWYAIWSLPYALRRRRVFAYLLVWFPLVSVVAEPSLATPWTMFLVIPALVAVSWRYSVQPRPS